MTDSTMSPATMIDLVIGVLVVEALALSVFGERWFKLPRSRALLPNLAAGFWLLLAVRSAVHEDGLVPLAAFLALAGIAHVLDLRSRRARNSAL